LVFALTAAVPLAATVTVPRLPRRDARAPAGRHGIIDALRSATLVRPAGIFATSASAAGVVVTYLPLALTGRAAWAAPAALFLQPAASTAGRWAAGRLGDRRGQAGLLVPGIALSITGMAAMAVTPSAVMVAIGATTFGTGFGVLQNATLSMMYARVDKTGYGAISAVWNASYDVGMALGALGAGPLATATGFTPAFLVTAATMLPALLMSQRETTPRPDPSRSFEAGPRAEPVPA
jgi:predicted MFS family arabinose efflux permease